MTLSRLPVIAVDTANLPLQDQFDAWRQAVGVTHEITSKHAVERDGLHASSTVWRLGQLVVSYRNIPDLTFSRRLGRASLDGYDHYSLIMMDRGTWTGDVSGRDITIHPGELCLFDLARPEDNHVTDSSSLRILVPRAPLDAALGGRTLHGLPVRGGAGALLVDYLRSLHHRLSEVTLDEASHVEQATQAMIMACIAPSAERAEIAAPVIDATLLQRARRLIDANLTSRELTPAAIARTLGVSRSVLYRLFEPAGGVAAYVQSRRLARIRALLTDPRERSRISDLAFRHGFVSEAHFSNAFRRAFGLSPSECRALAAEEERRRAGSEPGELYHSWVRGSTFR